MDAYLMEFFLILLGVGGGAYALPAGGFYWWFHLRKDSSSENRIQSNSRFTSEDIKREVSLSVKTVLMFTVLSFGLLQLVKSGKTAMYFDIEEFGWGYAVLSFFLCLIIHDTYFYWSHRFMHWRPIFKYTHLGHHKSRTPSPWAILAFQPGEAVIQFLIFGFLVMFLPLHPVVFGIYLVYDTLVNTAGHCGFELVPKYFAKHPILKLGNTVTHHDLHHIDVTKNYGSFFNIWDRIMNTFANELKKKS